MNINAFADEIAAAEERFAGREEARVDTLRKLEEGGSSLRTTLSASEKR